MWIWDFVSCEVHTAEASMGCMLDKAWTSRRVFRKSTGKLQKPVDSPLPNQMVWQRQHGYWLPSGQRNTLWVGWPICCILTSKWKEKTQQSSPCPLQSTQNATQWQYVCVLRGPCVVSTHQPPGTDCSCSTRCRDIGLYYQNWKQLCVGVCQFIKRGIEPLPTHCSLSMLPWSCSGTENAFW